MQFLVLLLCVLGLSGYQTIQSIMAETALVEDGASVRLQLIYKKPEGSGPFPLLLLNHGSTGRGYRPELFRREVFFDQIANYFVDRGWMVVTPQRRGRGSSDGIYDEGFNISRTDYTCETVRSLEGAERALTDVSAAYDVLVDRVDVDKSRVLVGGVSRGGILSVAFAGRNPDKVVGVLNFVGGWISTDCMNAYKINGPLARMGASFPKPMLWIYSKRDKHYSTKHTKNLFNFFVQAGGQGRYVVSGYGHGAWRRRSSWEKSVSTYLTALGYTEFAK